MLNSLKRWRERRLKKSIFTHLLKKSKSGVIDVRTVDVFYKYITGSAVETIVRELKEQQEY
jgi:hypothetical protein